MTPNELTAENHLILGVAKLNQHIYFKGVLTSKFDSKDMLLWKIGSTFISTEDEKPWIPSGLKWFDGPRSSKRAPQTIKILYPTNNSKMIVYKCLF